MEGNQSDIFLIFLNIVDICAGTVKSAIELQCFLVHSVSNRDEQRLQKVFDVILNFNYSGPL